MINSVPKQPLGIRQRVPILGQQQPTQQQQEQMANMQIRQAIHEMAVGMYVQLATAHIATRDQDLDPDVYPSNNVLELRPLAKKCLTAAKAFFEGLGILPIIETQDSEVEPDGSSE